MSDVDRYLILRGRGPSEYSSWAPDVPGCVAADATIDECVDAMHEALAGHLEVMREHGEGGPEPPGPGVDVEPGA